MLKFFRRLQISIALSVVLLPALEAHADVSAENRAAAKALYQQSFVMRTRPGLARQREKLIDKAMALDPQPDYIAAKAQVLINDDKTEEAHAVLNKWMSTFPNSSVLLAKLGDLQYSEGEIEKASKTLDQALKLDPREPRSCYLKSKICTQKGRLDEAIAYLGRAISAEPDWPWYYYDRSKLQAVKKNLAAARADADKSIQYIRPLPEASNLALMYVNRAQILCEIGRPDLADKDLTAAMATETEERTIISNAQSMYAKMGNKRKSDELLRKLKSFDYGL